MKFGRWIWGLRERFGPCLLLTDYPPDNELAMVTLIPHTTAVRGNQWEVVIEKPFLKKGAFHLQQIQSVSVAHLMRRLGVLGQEEWKQILSKIADRLSL